MRNFVFVAAAHSLLLVSCSQKTKSDVIVKVGDAELSKATLMQSMPQGVKGKDSIDWCNQWIEHWVLEQLLIEDAEKLEDPENIEEKINIYRNQLRIQALKDKIIFEQFDPQSVKVNLSEEDSTLAIGAKEVAAELKKMEIWQNYQKQLINQAVESGKWKK